MVITCPSCSARYRLNPDKIQGRGAKITCPKCSHVFVVFTDDGEARTEDVDTEQPRVKPQNRPASPTVELARSAAAATTTGAFKAVGISEAPAPPTNTDANIRIVAPGTRSTRRMRAVDSGETSVPAPPVVVERPNQQAQPENADVKSASDLDFRSVGIKTWKVKVAIGLIYDFSDIATLKKYLADKKVTPDDLISQNNKDWIRIGDIGDLDQHFIEAWKAAKAAVDSGQVALPEKKKASGTGSHSTLGHASATHNAVGRGTASLRPADTGSSRALSTGAYGIATEAPRRRKKKVAPVEEPPKRPRAFIIAGILLVGLVAAWRLMPSDGSGPVNDSPPIPVSDIKPPDAEMDRIRKRIQDELKKAADDARAEAAVGSAEDEAYDADDSSGGPKILVPVRPSEQTVTVSNPGDIRSPVNQPPQGQYQRPRFEAPTPAPVVDRSQGEVKETSAGDDPAKMYYVAGATKLKAGDFGSAQKMFTQATRKNAKCGKCWEGLAEAEKQLGHAPEAAAAAEKAAALGSPQSMASP